MKPTLKAPGTKPLKLKFDKLLSSCAFRINLRRYNEAKKQLGDANFLLKLVEFDKVARCRLTPSKPVLKLVRASGFSA